MFADFSSKIFEVTRWQDGVGQLARDEVVGEAPIALVYNGVTYAVMMATADDLEDFALGFSLAEEVIAAPGEVLDVVVQTAEHGIEIAITIPSARFHALKQHRRQLAGPTGCGLCGSDSLQQVMRAPRPVPLTQRMAADAICRAVAGLGASQPVNARTGAMHAAAWSDAHGNIVLLREDVGRHNALDKLRGALHRERTDASNGFVVVSSRASHEMVHKAVACGAELLVAVSAATSLAVEQATALGLSLVGFARGGRFTVYCGAERIVPEASKR